MHATVSAICSNLATRLHYLATVCDYQHMFALKLKRGFTLTAVAQQPRYKIRPGRLLSAAVQQFSAAAAGPRLHDAVPPLPVSMSHFAAQSLRSAASAKTLTGRAKLPARRHLTMSKPRRMPPPSRSKSSPTSAAMSEPSPSASTPALKGFLIKAAAAMAGAVSVGWFGMLSLPMLNNVDRWLYGPKPPVNHIQPVGWVEVGDKSLIHEYGIVNGVKVHYVTNNKTDKPLILFLHGFPECWYSWRNQLKEFGADFHVVAPDMRGYNQTQAPGLRADYSVASLVADVRALARHVNNSNKFTLVAHDWGAGVALAFAERYGREMLNRLIIINGVPGKVLLREWQDNPQQLASSWYMFFFQLPYVPELFMANSGISKILRSSLKNPQNLTAEDAKVYESAYPSPSSYTAPINYYRNIFSVGTIMTAMSKKQSSGTSLSRDGDSSSTSYAVDVKTLVIWGEEDPHLSITMLDKMGDYYKDVKIVKVKGAGHFAQQDAPDDINRHMREFLTGK